MSEQLPINPALKVLEHIDIYHTEKWWKAVVITEGFGKKTISVYLWTMKDGKWKRKQKLNIKNKGEWLELKEAVEKLLEKL